MHTTAEVTDWSQIRLAKQKKEAERVKNGKERRRKKGQKKE
jgi:hypothetical protein